MMTNGELNQFILHYLTKDKTHSAIMLTGSWGTGKSYYIQNVLVPFLKEDHKKECVTVSLYGLKSISEVSKNIYLELRAKALSAKGEAAIAGKLIAKTIAKGVVGRLGIDLSVDSSTMQELYESVDLSNRLVILEDVERSQIGILELLGYVNSLVEQDGVKVLLVANEEEILKNHYCEETELSAFEQGWLDDEQKPRSVKQMSEDAQKYLSVKEKTVSDTVQFTGEYTSAILQIIDSFDNSMLKKFANDASARTILNLMDIYKHHNLRSLIFACQKSVDIMESLDAPYGEDFVESIFFGIICFTFRFKAGKNLKWDENEHYSIELGRESFPLFKFCFDCITRQYIDVTTIAATAAAFDKKKLYDRRKTIGDSDLQTLCTYHAHYESEVLQAVESIDRRLDDQNDISFYDYGAIAVYSIIVKHFLGIDIQSIKSKLVNNLRGRGNELQIEELFRVVIGREDPVIVKEYKDLHKEMAEALKCGLDVIPGFGYLPEEVNQLYDYTIENEDRCLLRGWYAKSLNMEQVAKMFLKASPQQKDTIRAAFLAVYRPDNIKQFLVADAPAIEELRGMIAADAETQTDDKVQALQYRFFLENLDGILDKLK